LSSTALPNFASAAGESEFGFGIGIDCTVNRLVLNAREIFCFILDKQRLFPGRQFV